MFWVSEVKSQIKNNYNILIYIIVLICFPMIYYSFL